MLRLESMKISELRLTRISHEIPQIQLAVRAGMDRTRLSMLENGHVQPTDEYLTRLTTALDSLIQERRQLTKLAADAGLSLTGVRL
jgi:transcriptional regulator with XRE-family HTH domain